MPRTDQSRTRAHGTQTVQEDRRREKEVELYTRAVARLLRTHYVQVYTQVLEEGILRARTYTDEWRRDLTDCRIDPSFPFSSDRTLDDRISTQLSTHH